MREWKQKRKEKKEKGFNKFTYRFSKKTHNENNRVISKLNAYSSEKYTGQSDIYREVLITYKLVKFYSF